MSRFAVVRINRDSSDTHAGVDVAEAIERAQPDSGDVVEIQFVEAADAGAARLAGKPGAWVRWESRR